MARSVGCDMMWHNSQVHFSFAEVLAGRLPRLSESKKSLVLTLRWMSVAHSMKPQIGCSDNIWEIYIGVGPVLFLYRAMPHCQDHFFPAKVMIRAGAGFVIVDG